MIYIWLILTLPQDRLVCELWTRAPLTPAAIVQACGTDALDAYRLDVTRDGVGVCSIPAASLNWFLDDCHLSGPRDAYRLRVVEPNFQRTLCTVRTGGDAEPAWNEIAAQCPEAKRDQYVIRFWSKTEASTPTDAMCKPPAVTQPVSIATNNDYYLLAGRLIWYGYAKPQCPGGLSGVTLPNLSATTCGMNGARAKMIEWQNGLDASILSAAREWNVPADLLKSIIANETQFWGWTGVDGERGMIQITEDGAGVVLHVYLDGYYRLSAKQQHAARLAWLRALDCLNCSPAQAYEHAKKSMPLYAQSLAAYYCMFGSWNEAVAKWNIKYKASAGFDIGIANERR